MSTTWSLVKGRAKYLRKAVKATFERSQHDCPICAYRGPFFPSATPAIPNAGCPNCDSRPRHRLMALADRKLALLSGLGDGGSILHFAAEKSLRPMIARAAPAKYTRADIDPERGDVVLNIEKLDLADASYDVIICSHVLEHVDDARALGELVRVLRPGGKLILMVPLIEGWETTYENNAIETWKERKVHFGGGTHIRFYGRDFRERIRGAGFALEEFCATAEMVIQYALIPGERIFIGRKTIGSSR